MARINLAMNRSSPTKLRKSSTVIISDVSLILHHLEIGVPTASHCNPPVFTVQIFQVPQMSLFKIPQMVYVSVQSTNDGSRRYEKFEM